MAPSQKLVMYREKKEHDKKPENKQPRHSLETVVVNSMQRVLMTAIFFAHLVRNKTSFPRFLPLFRTAPVAIFVG